VDMKKNRDARWELYDLPGDPSEKTDVAGAHPELVRELDRIVEREHRRAHIREWEFVDSRMPPGTQP
jgi:arylsulfatase A